MLSVAECRAIPCQIYIINMYRVALSDSEVDHLYKGALNSQCGFCGALKFHWESINCCHSGKVSVPPVQAVPTTTHTFLTADTEEGHHFREHIRLCIQQFSRIGIFGGKCKHSTGLWPILLPNPWSDLPLVWSSPP